MMLTERVEPRKRLKDMALGRSQRGSLYEYALRFVHFRIGKVVFSPVFLWQPSLKTVSDSGVLTSLGPICTVIICHITYSGQTSSLAMIRDTVSPCKGKLFFVGYQYCFQVDIGRKVHIYMSLLHRSIYNILSSHLNPLVHQDVISSKRFQIRTWPLIMSALASKMFYHTGMAENYATTVAFGEHNTIIACITLLTTLGSDSTFSLWRPFHSVTRSPLYMGWKV